MTAPRADELLAAFRREHTLADPHRGEVWSRIEASLDAAPIDVAIEPHARRPTIRVRWVAALALAAGVVLGLAIAPHAAVLVDTTTTPPSAAEAELAPAPAHALEVHAPMPVAVPPAVLPALEVAAPASSTDTIADTITEPAHAAGIRAPRAPSTTTAIDDTDALVIESGLIRRARRTLRDGDAAGALAVLDAHAEAFPDGQMLEARLALRIEALCALGKPAQARAEATAMRRRFPDATLGADACTEHSAASHDTDR